MKWRAIAVVLLIALLVSLALNAYQYSFPRPVTSTATLTETTTSVMLKNEESSLSCTGATGQFLEEGLYSQLGYPRIGYNGYTSLEPQRANYTYWISRPDGALFYLGAMQGPVMNVCEALGLATSSLHLDPSNYTLAAVTFDAGMIIGGSVVSEFPSWTFFLARIYQGFWLDGTVGNVTENGGYSASVSVDAINGTVGAPSFDLSSLPVAGEHYNIILNASQAVKILRQSNESVIPSSLAVSGIVTSVFPRIVLLGNPSDNSSYFGPITSASFSGQKRLCWIIHLSSSSYQGYFGVDAETGQVLVAQTWPVNVSASSVGVRTVYISGPFAAIDYRDFQGVAVAQQSFQVNGSTLGVEGAFPVIVPNVIILAPGSSGSLKVNVTDECPRGFPCPSDVTLSTGSLPPGLSINFFRQELPLVGNQTVQNMMVISALQNATQGTYLIELDGLAVPLYFILSVWNGHSSWPILPLLAAESKYIVSPDVDG